MLAELLMATYGWNEVWAPGVGDPESPPPGADRHRPLDALTTPGFFVGVWTGPDKDMFCVRRCERKCHAEKYKSPPGYTVLDAAIRAFAVRLAGDLSQYACMTSGRTVLACSTSRRLRW